mmetsp:Transcript_29028/g.53117  ORF Transcript_29028/g.53117 Transcript_29028/m.53117 type:complete len:128 (+) Transcript_29028:1311-1694(+)
MFLASSEIAGTSSASSTDLRRRVVDANDGLTPNEVVDQLTRNPVAWMSNARIATTSTVTRIIESYLLTRRDRCTNLLCRQMDLLEADDFLVLNELSNAEDSHYCCDCYHFGCSLVFLVQIVPGPGPV